MIQGSATKVVSGFVFFIMVLIPGFLIPLTSCTEEPVVKDYPYLRFLNACPNCEPQQYAHTIYLHYPQVPDNIPVSEFDTNITGVLDTAATAASDAGALPSEVEQYTNGRDAIQSYYYKEVVTRPGSYEVDTELSTYNLRLDITEDQKEHILEILDLIDYNKRPYFQSKFGQLPEWYYNPNDSSKTPVPFPPGDYNPVTASIWYDNETYDIEKEFFSMRMGAKYTLVLAGTIDDLTQHPLTISSQVVDSTQRALEGKSRIRFFSFLPDIAETIEVFCGGCNSGEDMLFENIGYDVKGGSGYSVNIPAQVIPAGEFIARIFRNGKWQIIFQNEQSITLASQMNYTFNFIGYGFEGVQPGSTQKTDLMILNDF